MQVEFASLLFEGCAGRLESAPFLFSGDVIAWADESEHVRDFSGPLEAGVAFSLHCLELVAEDLIEVLVGGLVSFLFGVEHRADLLQLACVEPDSRAAGALVDFNLLFDAEEVSHHDDVVAFGALSFLFSVDDDAWVVVYIQQGFAGGFVGLIEFFDFEVVEPDSAAAVLAYVNGDFTDGHLL